VRPASVRPRASGKGSPTFPPVIRWERLYAGVMTVALRVDAEENRERILATARRLFERSGPGVPMASIARHAGVGLTTLYRRFPSRDQLMVDAFAEQHKECSDCFGRALADPDPGRGFRAYAKMLCASQVVDKGYTAALVQAMLTGEGMDRERAEGERVALAVLGRAQAAGAVRPDLTAQDLFLLIAGNAGVIAAAGPAAAPPPPAASCATCCTPSSNIRPTKATTIRPPKTTDSQPTKTTSNRPPKTTSSRPTKRNSGRPPKATSNRSPKTTSSRPTKRNSGRPPKATSNRSRRSRK
jgi:AcrR family transcriptional regulator